MAVHKLLIITVLNISRVFIKWKESYYLPMYILALQLWYTAGAPEPVPQVPRPRDQCWKQNLWISLRAGCRSSDSAIILVVRPRPRRTSHDVFPTPLYSSPDYSQQVNIGTQNFNCLSHEFVSRKPHPLQRGRVWSCCNHWVVTMAETWCDQSDAHSLEIACIVMELAQIGAETTSLLCRAPILHL